MQSLSLCSLNQLFSGVLAGAVVVVLINSRNEDVHGLLILQI